MLEARFRERRKLDPARLALLALSLASTGEHDRARSLVEELLRQAKLDRKRRRYWWARGDDPWLGNSTVATSLALKALVAVGGNSEAAGSAAMYLLSAREGGRWRSTFDTAMAVMALLDYGQSEVVAAESCSWKVRVNGEPLSEGQFLRGLPGAARQVAVPLELLSRSKPALIRLENAGPGEYSYAL